MGKSPAGHRPPPSFMPQTREFSQADPRVVQQPEGVDAEGGFPVTPRDVRHGTLEKYSGVEVRPGGWWENNLPTLSPLATVGGMVLLCDSPLGFPAHSVLVDNWTNQWLDIDGVRRAIPPYSGGWVFNSVSGTQQARVRLKVPSTAVTQPAALTGEYVWVGFAAAVLSPSTGIILPGGAAGASLLGSVRLQDGTSSLLAGIGNAGDGSTGFNNNNSILVTALGWLFNGVSYDRARNASAANLFAQSGLGVALASPPGMWSVVHTPAVGSQATATRAAGGAGVRHICTGIIVSFGAIAAPAGTLLQWNLRDGVSGAGTILASGQVVIPPAVLASDNIVLSGLAIPGSAATAMTLEFSALLANLAEGVTLLGYDAS